VPDDAALIIYTSGTTGRPKGVVRSQRAEVRYAELMSGLLATRGNTRQLLMMPFFHIGARCQYIASFWRAGAVHVHRKFDPTEILKTIQQHRITHLHVAPTMLQSILDVPDIENYDVSSVETLLYSAAPMPTPLLQRGIAIFGNVFANGYGGTEANATYLAPHQHHPNGKSKQVARLASVGQAIVDVELRIVDDAGNVCPTGIRGEVAVRTDTMLDQYWNNGPATVEALRDGFFHTGDIGYLDDEGYLFLVDRKKDMIISGGENVYCREVEEAIEKHPAVFEVAIIGVLDEKWGETVRAIVVLNAGMKLTATDLIEYVRGRIAHYKCPKSVVFVDALPRLQSGKVSKVTLRERFSGDL
jgi:acyl-CoA synthetase (AMP-forming)/AMP-acid ligase II